MPAQAAACSCCSSSEAADEEEDCSSVVGVSDTGLRESTGSCGFKFLSSSGATMRSEGRGFVSGVAESARIWGGGCRGGAEESMEREGTRRPCSLFSVEELQEVFRILCLHRNTP